ncbi:MAG: formyl transferase [Acidobacteria bacterium]|jgi:folate-dependent phosphoribosylglycinamide formyltransferase PurN|nr:formyl transferase [Acidobacteriota bacterium]
MKTKNTIVLLCSDGDSTRAIGNALQKKFGAIKVVMEKPMSRLEMAKKRTKKIGFIKVTGQILFVALIVPLLSRFSRQRFAEIEAANNLANDWAETDIIEIDSVNSEKARDVLREIQPDIVVVNGTRIIGKKTLKCINATFINTHAGITPLYRGVHGAYWALAEGKPELVGTTVHLVDEGIDTGTIIEQAFFEITEKDNFATYPYLHTAAGIPVLLRAVEYCIEGKLEAKVEASDLPSKLRYHPTIWEYLFYRIRKGVS